MKLKTNHRGIRMPIPALLAGALLLSACTIGSMGTSIPEAAAPADQTPSIVREEPLTPESTSPTVAPPSSTGTTMTYGEMTFILSPAIANGASGSEMPRLDSADAAWWQKTPGHLQVMLGDYYVLQGKFHQPRIDVYPAQEYAELVPTAFESIHRLNNLLGNPNTIPAGQLPDVPFFNSRAIFASNIEKISFQNGSGVRFLTEYTQHNAPVNNNELFYHFQGVTSDGAYYIIAIFPVTARELAETGDPAATVPPDGVAYPDINDVDARWAGYYAAVTDLLNAAPNDSFTPQLGQLDALIHSIVIAAP